MKAKKIDKDIVIVGILCITVLELFALNLGFDGLSLTTVIAIIAVAIGVTIPNPIRSK